MHTGSARRLTIIIVVCGVRTVQDESREMYKIDHSVHENHGGVKSFLFLSTVTLHRLLRLSPEVEISDLDLATKFWTTPKNFR